MMKEKREKTMERREAVKLSFDQSRAWDIYRDDQISKLLAEAMDRLHEPIIKIILRFGIARIVDQRHNTADRKISAYESGAPLSLDELFTDNGRSTAKALAYDQAMELFIEAAMVNKDAAKTVIRNAKKIDSGDAWKRAVAELERIIG